MISLKLAHIYITNVCNLNCVDCTSFNNFDFRGHQRWSDYRDIYRTWSEKLHLDEIAILGGEPFANPDLLAWVDGIMEFWPHSRINIVTNGTQLNRYPELSDRLDLHAHRLTIHINAHGLALRQEIYRDLRVWLHGNITQINRPRPEEIESWLQCYRNIRQSTWPCISDPREFVDLPSEIQQECRQSFNLDYHSWYDNLWGAEFTNDCGARVSVHLTNMFHAAAIQIDPASSRPRLHHSNTASAYSVCHGRDQVLGVHAHHFNHGRLYKCSTTSLLPEMIKQFELAITPEERELILAYRPCRHDATERELIDFVQDLKKDQPIVQCRFCPESNLRGQPFESGPKKIRLVRRQPSK